MDSLMRNSGSVFADALFRSADKIVDSLGSSAHGGIVYGIMHKLPISSRLEHVGFSQDPEVL